MFYFNTTPKRYIKVQQRTFEERESAKANILLYLRVFYLLHDVWAKSGDAYRSSGVRNAVRVRRNHLAVLVERFHLDVAAM